MRPSKFRFPDSTDTTARFPTFLQAGLPAPQLRLDAPIGGGLGWPRYAYLASTVQSPLPFLERVGAVTPEQVDIDTLEERLRREVVEQDSIQILAPLIGAWARTIT